MRSYAVLPLAIVALGCGRGAEGHCNLELPGWVCAPATGGGSVVLQPCLQGDGGNPPEPLASPVQDGRCTVTGVIDTTVDTTNPEMPAHTTEPAACFACDTGALGSEWICEPTGWQRVASGYSEYSCSIGGATGGLPY
jgi:hypothetical protein